MRQPATDSNAHGASFWACWVARRWSPCRLFLSLVSRPNRKRISVSVSLFLPLRLRLQRGRLPRRGRPWWCASEVEQ